MLAAMWDSFINILSNTCISFLMSGYQSLVIDKDMNDCDYYHVKGTHRKKNEQHGN